MKKSGKLAAQKYVTFKGGSHLNKTTKPTVLYPSVKPKTTTPAQRGGLAEDLGKC